MNARGARLAGLALAVLAVLLSAGAFLLPAKPTASVRYSAGASRFLQLTGGATPAAQPAAGVNYAAVGPGPVLVTDPEALPNGWHLSPAGSQVAVPRFPLGLGVSADGSKVIASSDSGGAQALSVIDASSPGKIGTPTTTSNLFMGVAASPSGTIYASGGNANRVWRLRLAGSALVHEDATAAVTFPVNNALQGITARIPGSSSAPRPPAGDGIEVHEYPALELAAGNLLFVAGNVAEPSASGAGACAGQAICSHVTIIDTSAIPETIVARVPVGLEAYGLAYDPSRKLLYVSNWADQAGRGGLGGGTVSIVDVSNPATAREVGYVGVGHHPSAIQLSADRTRLFVANTNDDTISVIALDQATPAVIATESVKPLTGVPVGAHPDAFALSPDGKNLFVALAGMNAVEIRDGVTGARLSGQPVYIPTGWYPSALAVTSRPGGYRLWVANAKGNGFGFGYNGTVFFEGSTTGGTVGAVDLPVSSGQEKKWTAQVGDNDKLNNVNLNPCAKDLQPSEVLCPPAGQQSPIKHVVYIVTENKTFDQYFGDLTKGGYDADPSYAIYGQNVTPNHHKLAAAYSLGDRFYSDAEVSVTGHSWTSGAIATDHNEKTWAADYDQGVRGTHGSSGDPLRPSISSSGGAIAAADDVLNDPQGGYLFEAFRRAGAQPPGTPGAALTMGIYGEHTAAASGDMSAYKATGHNADGSPADWKAGDIQYYDTCRADEFITGKAPDSVGGANSPNDSGSPSSYFADCQGRTLNPQFTLAQWEKDWAAGRDTMPNFIYMSLPVNHTVGTNLGSPTPASMVADNDYAIGLIVQALSRSPFWSSTAVIQTEDDTQVAGDHVSPLRDYLAVSGPWARPGPNHQWGSMPALLRTIELLFNVQPITLYDRLAVPMHGAFLPSLNNKPNLDPYTAVSPLVPFALNQPGAAGQAQSMAMDWSQVDQIDEALLNAILVADARHIPLQLPAGH